jgi:hypothetical protein
LKTVLATGANLCGSAFRPAAAIIGFFLQLIIIKGYERTNLFFPIYFLKSKAGVQMAIYSHGSSKDLTAL